MKIPYLLALSARLFNGLKSLTPAQVERHRTFFQSRRQSDGGFAGREAGSDLYYTGFAVRGLALLNDLAPPTLDLLADYLRRQQTVKVGVIDLVSWLYSAAMVQGAGGPLLLDPQADEFANRVAGVLESYRSPDGGYAKSHDGALGSTYQSFLVALCLELIDRPIPRPDAMIEFVRRRHRDDGGFVEIDPMKRSGANPTAAAIALLRLLGALDEDTKTRVAGFLNALRGEEGGFRANSRIPFCDSLSTFTTVLTAQDIGARALIDPQRVRRFILSLEQTGGGFGGASWDQYADVEYTFYGLGTIGLLSADLV